jgi:coenzyme Q-binding protein COQ10
MPSHSEKRILPYSPQQMFELVADVERYQEFLPWCVGSRINSRGNAGFNADVLIGYGGIRESFNSDVVLTPYEGIDVEYRSGPFAHLHNHWLFRPVAAPLPEGTCAAVPLNQRPDVMQFTPGPACGIEFFIDFSFNSGLLNALIEGFFHDAVRNMVDAFEKRAGALYK